MIVYKSTMPCETLLQASKSSKLVSEICAGLATGIALLALLGWISGARFLAGELGTYIPMAPSTAVAFLLLGGALFGLAHLHVSRSVRFFELAAVSIVLLIGLFVLAQFIFRIDLGIERVLSRTNELLGSTPLGRMSSVSAISFLLEGAALLILLSGEKWRNAPRTVAALAAGATAVNTVVVIGYIFGAPLLYGGTSIPVALPGAIAFVLVGLGQLNLAVPGISTLRKWSGVSMRGILLRAFLPFLLLFILLDSWSEIAFAPIVKRNPAVWYSLKMLVAGVLILITVAWIARRTGGEIERAQKARAESEARFRHLFTTSPDAILLIDPHHPAISWPITDGNKAAFQMNGYTREDLIGRSIDVLNVAPGTKEERDAYLDRLRREGVIHIETLHRHKDGHTFPVEVSTSLFAFEGRELVVGIDRDITDRKQAEQALEERVKQLTALHEIAVTSTQVDSVDRLIEAATEIIAKNLYSDNFGILLMDEEKEILHAHPSYRFNSTNELSAIEVPLGQGVTGQVAQTGQRIRIGNIEGLQNYLNIDPRTSSELCVPIKLKERILGVINAESTRPNAFTFDDELLLGTLAGQLATAIEQIRAAQAERQWLSQLAHSNALIYAIAQITTHIEKALTEAEIIQSLGRELNKIELTCCMAIYQTGRQIFAINYTSIAPKDLDQVEKRIGFPLINHSFSLQKLHSILNNENILHSAVVNNPENEIKILIRQRREEGLSEILQEIGIHPEGVMLRLPLVFEENLLGMLWIWGKDITKADLPIMSIFAKQIGSSLERARLFQEVQSLALTDPLTGLQNRRSLFELGKVEFSRSYRMQRPFCCMMLDLDHFKRINDNYGHLVGDLVLQEFAERCKGSVRDVDLVGRYGGEEVLIFLPETDTKTALQVAERLRRSVEERPMIVSDQKIFITVSVGVSGKDENTAQLETLVARADQALYIAKHKGRNCVAISK